MSDTEKENCKTEMLAELLLDDRGGLRTTQMKVLVVAMLRRYGPKPNLEQTAAHLLASLERDWIVLDGNGHLLPDTRTERCGACNGNGFTDKDGNPVEGVFPCSECDGLGHLPVGEKVMGRPCLYCCGHGILDAEGRPIQTYHDCPKCLGRGRIELTKENETTTQEKGNQP